MITCLLHMLRNMTRSSNMNIVFLLQVLIKNGCFALHLGVMRSSRTLWRRSEGSQGRSSEMISLPRGIFPNPSRRGHVMYSTLAKVKPYLYLKQVWIRCNPHFVNTAVRHTLTLFLSISEMTPKNRGLFDLNLTWSEGNNSRCSSYEHTPQPHTFSSPFRLSPGPGPLQNTWT